MKPKRDRFSMQRVGEGLSRTMARFSKNWLVKIVCLAFAVFLSQFYRGTLQDTRYMFVPLVLQNDGPLAPAEQYPGKIKVSVWGDANSIGSIGEDDISAVIDISEFKTDGSYRVPIRTKLNGMMTPLGNIEISAEPSMLSLQLETRVRKSVPAALSLKGIPADGYEVTESSIEPATVEIEGPSGLVEKVEELVTEPLSIEARTNGFSGSAVILNDESLISIVGKAQVQHTVKISEMITQKTFENIPIYFTKSNREFSITSDKKTGSLEIRGPKKLLETWRPSENILTVSCESITEPGSYTLPIEPILPVEYSKFKILRFAPKSVQVTVEPLQDSVAESENTWSSGSE